MLKLQLMIQAKMMLIFVVQVGFLQIRELGVVRMSASSFSIVKRSSTWKRLTWKSSR